MEAAGLEAALSWSAGRKPSGRGKAPQGPTAEEEAARAASPVDAGASSQVTGKVYALYRVGQAITQARQGIGAPRKCTGAQERNALMRRRPELWRKDRWHRWLSAAGVPYLEGCT